MSLKIKTRKINNKQKQQQQNTTTTFTINNEQTNKNQTKNNHSIIQSSRQSNDRANKQASKQPTNQPTKQTNKQKTSLTLKFRPDNSSKGRNAYLSLPFHASPQGAAAYPKLCLQLYVIESARCGVRVCECVGGWVGEGGARARVRI